MDVWANAGIGGGKSASEGTCYKEREIMDYKHCEKLTEAILAVATNLKWIFYAILSMAISLIFIAGSILSIANN